MNQSGWSNFEYSLIAIENIWHYCEKFDKLYKTVDFWSLGALTSPIKYVVENWKKMNFNFWLLH